MKASDYIRRLEHSGITNPQQEVIWLMSEALGVSHSEILTHRDFTGQELTRIESFITRRESGEPLQYITGEATFCGRDFCVGPGVLIPRQDTEALIIAARSCFDPDSDFTFLDWGTGSGCIAITMLLEFPNSFAYMLDVSQEALSYALKNLERYRLEARSRIITKPDDISMDTRLRLIISNPPYISTSQIAGLMKTVRDYEPLTALDGGLNGMKYYSEIFALSQGILEHNGYIILETGDMTQTGALKRLKWEKFSFVREFRDSGGFPRALIFQKE